MGLRLAVDTSAYSAQILNRPSVTAFINAKNELHIPIIVIAELRAGFASGSREANNLNILRAFLGAPNTHILLTTELTAEIYARIHKNLKIMGRPIGTNDIWIAAICIENNLPLLTLDNDFKNIKELKLV